MEKLRKGCTHTQKKGCVRQKTSKHTTLLQTREQNLIVEYIPFLQSYSLFDPYTLHFKREALNLLEKEEACWNG